MQITELITNGICFFYMHAPLGVIIILVLGISVYFKPKSMARLATLLLFLGAAFYTLSLIGEMTFAGMSKKETMVSKVTLHPDNTICNTN